MHGWGMGAGSAVPFRSQRSLTQYRVPSGTVGPALPVRWRWPLALIDRQFRLGIEEVQLARVHVQPKTVTGCDLEMRLEARGQGFVPDLSIYIQVGSHHLDDVDLDVNRGVVRRCGGL